MVPMKYHDVVMRSKYEMKTTGHMGVFKTLEQIAKTYRWGDEERCSNVGEDMPSMLIILKGKR